MRGGDMRVDSRRSGTGRTCQIGRGAKRSWSMYLFINIDTTVMCEVFKKV